MQDLETFPSRKKNSQKTLISQMHQQGNIIVNILSFSHKVEVQKNKPWFGQSYETLTEKIKIKFKKNKLGLCYVIDKADYQEQINKW